MPSVPVMCFFCQEKFDDSELESHMREKHQMMTMFYPVARVKCIFCMEEVDEKDMESHIRMVHRIFGLQFNYEQAETSTQTQYESISPDFSLNQSFMDDSDVDEKERFENENKRQKTESNENTQCAKKQADMINNVAMIKTNDRENKPMKDVTTKTTATERYRCSSCDFYHNKVNFLKRHIRIEHRSITDKSFPVKQTMKVVMKRKPIEKVIQKDSKEKTTEKTESNTNLDVEVLAIYPENEIIFLKKDKHKASNLKLEETENIENDNQISSIDCNIVDVDEHSDIEILSEHLTTQPSCNDTSNNYRNDSRLQTRKHKSTEKKKTIVKEVDNSLFELNDDDQKDILKGLEECLFCKKMVEKSKLESHIEEDHKIGLCAAVAKLLDIHNKKAAKSETSADLDFTGENPFGISFYPVLDEIADNEDLVNRISFSAPGVMDQVYLPVNQSETVGETSQPSVSRFRCPACDFHNGKIYLVIEHIIDLHQGYKKVDTGNMHPIKQEMKIFIEKIKKKNKNESTGKRNNIHENNEEDDAIHSESEPEMEHADYVSIEGFKSKNENGPNVSKTASNLPTIKTGNEDDDFIEVIYESVVSKSECERKKKKVTFSFHEINSFYRCKKKPKDHSSQLIPTSGKSSAIFSILKNDSILNESMQYWASKNNPTDPVQKTTVTKQIAKSPHLLDPGLCDQISLTIFGVRFRCPSCLLHDDKLRVVREHIIEAHQGFHQGDVDQFIDCLEPVKQTMKVGLVNVSQIEIEKIQERQHEKEKMRAIAKSKRKKLRTENWILQKESRIVQKSPVKCKITNEKLQSDIKETSQVDNLQAQISVPAQRSTSETSSLPDNLVIDKNHTDRDIGEVCQIVVDIENNWKDVLEAEMSLDDFEKKIFLDGDNTNWNTSLFDRLSLTSSSTSSDMDITNVINNTAHKISTSGSDIAGSLTSSDEAFGK